MDSGGGLLLVVSPPMNIHVRLFTSMSTLLFAPEFAEDYLLKMEEAIKVLEKAVEESNQANT